MNRGKLGRIPIAGAVLCLAVAASPALAQDHEEYDPADIVYGRTVYERECTICHAADGAGVAGVDLRNGPLRRATSDRRLGLVITNGIPDTGMVAISLDAAELAGVIAYVRNMNYDEENVELGDAVRGKAVFDGAGNCLQCHRRDGEGARSGIDLTSIGARRAAGALRRTLLDPTGTMRPIDRPVRLVTADGTTVTGRRLNEDTFSVQIVDEMGRLRSFEKADLQELEVARESPMPVYGDRLDPEALADLLAYLVSLKG